MMVNPEREKLLRAIQSAKADEDRAWAGAAELRSKGTSDSALLSAIQLMEATTSKRMKLEAALKGVRGD